MRYPHEPGAKERGGTSEIAALEITSRADTLRAKAYSWLHAGDFTADEIAEKMGESILAIRPRLSELYRLGLIVKTPATRRNISGKLARVWSIDLARWELKQQDLLL
jgi:transcription initiation factor IIE alpha subunit